MSKILIVFLATFSEYAPSAYSTQLCTERPYTTSLEEARLITTGVFGRVSPRVKNIVQKRRDARMHFRYLGRTSLFKPYPILETCIISRRD